MLHLLAGGLDFLHFLGRRRRRLFGLLLASFFDKDFAETLLGFGLLLDLGGNWERVHRLGLRFRGGQQNSLNLEGFDELLFLFPFGRLIVSLSKLSMKRRSDLYWANLSALVIAQSL